MRNAHKNGGINFSTIFCVPSWVSVLETIIAILFQVQPPINSMEEKTMGDLTNMPYGISDCLNKKFICSLVWFQNNVFSDRKKKEQHWTLVYQKCGVSCFVLWIHLSNGTTFKAFLTGNYVHIPLFFFQCYSWTYW